MANIHPSPFAELSFSEQQEQWRIFRAQHLDFQQVAEKEEAPIPRPAPVYTGPSGHHNLDRVRAQLAAASRRAGAYQPVTSRE